MSAQTKKRVGIFSGSFDPIHDGHINFALNAASTYSLDRVFFMPEPRPRRKQGVKALEHRLTMVRLAIQNQGLLGVIAMHQQRFSPEFTWPVLKERFKGAQLFLLIGDDAAEYLGHWPHLESLTDDCTFIIAARKFSAVKTDGTMQATQRAKGLKQIKYFILPIENTEASSSKIKKSIKNNSNYEHLDPRVAQYIREQNLYTAK